MVEINRRSFLKVLASAAGVATLDHLFKPALLFADAGGSSGKNIILVNLIGGYDGLTQFPFYDGPCAEALRGVLRPTINIPLENVLLPNAQTGLPNRLGCHPSWARLVGDPNAIGAVIPGEASGHVRQLKTVGYASSDPGRSHDECQNLFSMGRKAQGSADRRGWLARFMDLFDWQSLQVYGIGSGTKLDFNTEKEKPVVVGRLTDFNYISRNFGGGSFTKQGSTSKASTNAALDSELARRFLKELNLSTRSSSVIEEAYLQASATTDSAISFVRQASQVALQGEYRAYNLDFVNKPHDYTNRGFSGVSNFGTNCQDCARILTQAAQDPLLSSKAKFVYLQRGGWDSHSGQRTSLPPQIADVAASLSGLVSDLKASGIWSNTVIYLFTEFGRTNYENSSDATRAGTDHAYANNHLLLGGSVTPGVSGQDPTLTQMTNKDYLVPSIDFRQVLREVLQWAGVNSGAIGSVFPEQYPSNGALNLFS